MKQRLIVLLIAAHLAVPATADTLEKIMSDGATVGFGVDPPWGIVNPDGTMGGAYPEMDAAILKEMGVPSVKGEPMDFGALIPSLLSGRTDFNSSLLNITPERCEAVLFADPSGCGIETLIIRKEQADTVKSYADLAKAGLKVAIMPGGEPMTSLANNANIPEANRVAFTDYGDAVKLLEAGRVDAIPGSDATAKDLIERYGQGDKFAVVPLYETITCSAATFRKEDTALRDAYNVAFNKLLDEGKIAEILSKYDIAYVLNDLDKTSIGALCAKP